MKRTSVRTLLAVAAAAASFVAIAAPALAQPTMSRPSPDTPNVPGVKLTFVHLAQEVPAVLYEPTAPGAKSQIALLVTHGGDYLTFSACTQLSERGYRVLCMDPSGENLDRTLLETKLGVDFLRRYPGVRKVVLFGHSGGATIVSAYQDIAENGVKVCQDAQKVHKCPDNLAGLTPADGIVMPDANYGNAEMMLFSVDPALTDDHNGKTLDPALDLYNPANGFNPVAPNYSPAFIRTFQTAQARRYARLVDSAQQQMAAIEAGAGPYDDDAPFAIAGASSLGPNNKLFSQDPALLSHTKRAWPLLKADGTSVVQIVHTVRRPESLKRTDPSFGLASYKGTLSEFLAGSALRVDPDFSYDADDIHGVEWTSSYASPPGNVEGVGVPLLAMGMTGHWEFLAAEFIYDHAKSPDKSIAFVEGASHMYAPCKECEKTPGEFGDTMKTLYDYIDAWLAKPGRFI
ncbi:MAG TPA: hypothetical protein VMU59_00550 [Caulobacteraceae bacterium]|nr:hypothetical protein [Caulobacteraceae bacterium]